MYRTPAKLLLIAVAVSFLGGIARATDFVLVDDVGNLPEPESGRGSVGYPFLIATLEVTNAEYVVFLNAVDPFGVNPHDIYQFQMSATVAGGIELQQSAPNGAKYTAKLNYANKPVTHVTLVNAMQYCNWLHNGQGLAETQCGAYDLTQPGPPPSKRSPGARYFLPSIDEFYKSAWFHPIGNPACGNGAWRRYATGCDDPPTPAVVNAIGDVTNPGANVVVYDRAANWGGVTNCFFATVGTCGGASRSSYGTYDQTGNVAEWVEGLDDNDFIALGGDYLDCEFWVAAPGRQTTPGFPTGGGTRGFRIARPLHIPGDSNADGRVDGQDLQGFINCLIAGDDNCGITIAGLVNLLIQLDCP